MCKAGGPQRTWLRRTAYGGLYQCRYKNTNCNKIPVLLWTHSHTNGWFQIHILKHLVTHKSVTEFTVLMSVHPVALP